jgi:hypothetical protein
MWSFDIRNRCCCRTFSGRQDTRGSYSIDSLDVTRIRDGRSNKSTECYLLLKRSDRHTVAATRGVVANIYSFGQQVVARRELTSLSHHVVSCI